MWIFNFLIWFFLAAIVVLIGFMYSRYLRYKKAFEFLNALMKQKDPFAMKVRDNQVLYFKNTRFVKPGEIPAFLDETVSVLKCLV